MTDALSSVSPLLGLPYLLPGQAGKEVTVNDAFDRLDLLCNLRLLAVGLNQPPAERLAGQAWGTGEEPVGAWAGQPRKIAQWLNGWRFYDPWPGMMAYVLALGALRVWDPDRGWIAPATAGNVAAADVSWSGAGWLAGAASVAAALERIATQPRIIAAGGYDMIRGELRGPLFGFGNAYVQDVTWPIMVWEFATPQPDMAYHAVVSTYDGENFFCDMEGSSVTAIRNLYRDASFGIRRVADAYCVVFR